MSVEAFLWMNADQTLLQRHWDNTPHFPDLPAFPITAMPAATELLNPVRP